MIKKIIAACATATLLLPMLTGAQTFEDHTKIRTLSGKPSTPPTEVPSCPSGSTLSGGQCVLISNQSALKIEDITAEAQYVDYRCGVGGNTWVSATRQKIVYSDGSTSYTPWRSTGINDNCSY